MQQPAVLATSRRTDDVVASLTRNLSVMLAAQVVTFTLSFILRAALGRYLGDAGYGKLTFALSIGAIFMTIGGLGLGPLVTKEAARARDLSGHYLSNGVALRLLIGVPLYLGFCFVVAMLKGDDETRALTDLVGFSLLVNLIVTMTGAVFQAHEKMIYVSLGLIVEKLLTTVLSIALLGLGFGVVAVGWVMVVAALANLAASSFFLTRLGTLRLAIDLRSVASLFVSGIPYFIWAAFTTIYARIDATMLSLMTTDRVTGWYGVSYTLYETLGFLPGLIKTVALPVLSRLFVGDQTRFRVTFRQMFYVFALITPAIAFGTFALARPIVGLIYSLDQFGNSVVVLQVLGLGFIPLFFNILLATAVIAVDNQRYWSIAAVACAVVNPAMNLFLIPYFQTTFGNGGIGAAWATNGIEVILFIVGLASIPKGLIGRQEVAVVARTMLAGLAMGGLLAWKHDLSLPASLILGGVVYAGLCLVLGAFKASELRGLLALLRYDRANADDSRQAKVAPALPLHADRSLFVSIVIPTHNRREILRRVLTALAEQTYPPDRFEVIVVVDGSSDGTGSMLASLRQPYSLRVIEQDQQGPSAARNAGIAAALGQTIIFLDDDVVPVPRLVEAHASFHARDERAVVIGRLLASAEGRRTGWGAWEDAITERGYQQIQRGQVQVDGNFFYSGNVSASRQSLREVGGFDTTLAYQEDVELGHRLYARGDHFYFAPDAAGLHLGQCTDFDSWCRRHYRFGVYRLLIQQRADPAGFSPLGESYRRYHPLTRLLLSLVVGRPGAITVAAAVLRAAAATLDLARLWPISRFAYSALANLHYWRGIQDGLGSSTVARHLLSMDRETEGQLLRTGESRANTLNPVEG